jgi:predicted P-loop ATPase
MTHKLRIAVNKGCVNKTNPNLVADGWKNIEQDINWLQQWVTAGFGWCATHFADRYRRSENCRGSNVVVIDIDGDTTLDKFWECDTVKQWCLATYTSASHSDNEHRFRALFRCEIQLDTVALHRSAYWLVVNRITQELGLESLQDNCGQKPERLWYGNEHAEFRIREAAAIPEFILKDLDATDDEYVFEKTDVQKIDIDRCDWLLRNFLNPSSDGEYETVYVPVMAACAALGESVFDAWVEWVLKGHHGHKEENTKPYKWRGLGGKSGHTKLYRMAKDQDASWTSHLPSHLRFQSKINQAYAEVEPAPDFSQVSEGAGVLPAAQDMPEPEPDLSQVQSTRRRGRPKKTTDDLVAEINQDYEIVRQYLPNLRRNVLTRNWEYTDDNNKIVSMEGDSLDVMSVKFAIEFGVGIPDRRIKAAILYAVSQNPYCPIREYLKCCEKLDPSDSWDKLGQIYFSNDNPIVTLALQRMMIGAVARAFEPGAPMSWIPIIIGAQGAGKSMFARSLVPDNLFAEMPLQIEQLMREIYRLHCGWILELSEVDHYFNRKQIENFKNLVSTRVDEVRFPYERLPSKLARRFIMIGTTNRSQFLIDCSGNRRFVPIEVTDGFQVPWQRLCMERDNLWSSAIRAYKAKTQYEFTSGEIANISTYVNSFSEVDPWFDEVSKYIEDKVEVFPAEILQKGLNIPVERLDMAHSRRVCELLTSLGWRRGKKQMRIDLNDGDGRKKRHMWTRSESARPMVEPLDNF